MACGKWNCDSAIFGQTIAAAFSKDVKPVNPFEHRVERPKTEAELAELQAAKDRIEAIRQRVAEKQRAQSDGSGRQ